jgi:hypothetical protein
MTLPEEQRSHAAAPSAGAQPPVAPLSPGEQPQVAPLSQWLQLMLAEIVRKREELECTRSEQARRELERVPGAFGAAENLPTR